jgi:hypothetical protein
MRIDLRFAAAVAVGLLASCAVSTADDPYPGRGGELFREPTVRDIANSRLQFDADKLATLRIGTSTKREIVTMFGEPTWWDTGDSGYSRIDYDFHLKGGSVNTPDLVPATFVFDSNNVLVDADYVGSHKTVHVNHEPNTFAYFEGLVGSNALFIDGEIPADWAGGVPVGGYIRAPVRVRNVVAGEVPRSSLTLVFTVAGQRIKPWPAYFLVETDRFGTTTVMTWDLGPGLCKIADAEVDRVNSEDPGFKTFIDVVKSKPICTSEAASH